MLPSVEERPKKNFERRVVNYCTHLFAYKKKFVFCSVEDMSSVICVQHHETNQKERKIFFYTNNISIPSLWLSLLINSVSYTHTRWETIRKCTFGHDIPHYTVTCVLLFVKISLEKLHVELWVWPRYTIIETYNSHERFERVLSNQYQFQWLCSNFFFFSISISFHYLTKVLSII